MKDGWHPLIDGFPPNWASDWGEDRFGPFVGIRVGEAVQRLRWIPPGQFLMGSPNEEAGHLTTEEPRHKVTISQGFWLSDTPITQELWEAAMGKNPSRFKGTHRPVEQIDWHDCQRFCTALEKHLPGSTPHLPTEAQWEYACRASTNKTVQEDRPGARSESDSPAATSWNYENSESITHPVKEKAPNAWGLYDMLGNVWEWCMDGQREYTDQPQQDPKGPTGKGERRVTRGGSWYRDSIYVRAACRNACVPETRDSDLGLRLAIPHEQLAGESEKVDQTYNSQITDYNYLRERPEANHPKKRRLHRPQYLKSAQAPRGGVELILIPAGRLLMGSAEDEEGREDNEGPQHWVEISDFYLSPTLITNAHYSEYIKSNPLAEKPRYWKELKYNHPNQPVTGISWHEAQQYCEWAGLRLPTEAQWEYACRAGTETRFCSGDQNEDLKSVGWCRENSNGQLHDVGELEPNAFGIYDMHGNVYEWCLDAYASYENFSPRTGDGLRREPVGGAERVLRGGDYNTFAQWARSACRNFRFPDGRYEILGFRPTMVIP